MLCLLLVLYLTAVYGQFQCSFSVGSTYYNLNGVTLNAAMGDYQGSDADSVYVMNVCQICNTGGPCAESNGTICQYNNGGLAVFQGVLATMNSPYPLWSQIDPSQPTKGVKLTYTNSGTCDNGLTRTTTVYLECDPDAPLKGTMSVANDSTACTYDFHLVTPNSCPIAQNIASLTSGKNTTSTIQASSFTYWYTNVLNISNTAELKITLLQQDPTAFGNLILYIRYGALPTTQTYDRADAAYSLSHELVIRTTDNPEDNPLRAGAYYIGIQSTGYNITYLIRPDQFACPGGCNGHGLCVNQVCSCDFGWTMTDCGSSVQDANWDQAYNNTLYNTQVAYYRVNIQDPNEYQMVVNVARLGGSAIGSIAVGAGYYPTLTKNDGLVRDSLAPGPNLRLTMQNPNLGTGIWLIGVFGQDDEVYNYSVTIHLFDCPNNCSENGVCNPASHVCNCNADWAGTSDCSTYQETLIKTITSSFLLPAWQTLYFKIEVTDADLVYENDMTITLQSAPGAGSPPNVYVQYGVFPTYKNYLVTGPSPRKSSQVLMIAAADVKTGIYYVAMQSEDPADHPGSVKYQFENDCSFCVHGTCDMYTYLCMCDNGWEGANCDVETQSSASGTSVGVTVALVFIFLFVGIAAGVLLKRQFPSLCGESTTGGSVQNERELIPKYSAL